VRYELGTKERELVSDYIFTQALAKGGSGLAIGAGIAIAGMLMYSTLDDIGKWWANGWETGFGLVEDPAATSAQVSNALAPADSNLNMDALPEGYPSMNFTGMSIYTIYELDTQHRKTIQDFCVNALASSRGQENAGGFQYQMLQEFQNYVFMKTYPLCLQTPVIGSSGEQNSMSEYGYQMTIREISARNDFAQTAGIGFAAIGLGVQGILRASGFMQNEAWSGVDWKRAPGAIMDPLLSFAWARTNFETGNWWSTADAPGGNNFASNMASDVRGDIFLHTVPGQSELGIKQWSYEEVLWCASFEIEEFVGTEIPCPFLEYILAPLGLSVESVQLTDGPPPEVDLIGPPTAEDSGYIPAWKAAGFESYEEYEEEALKQSEDRYARMQREGRERAENYAETGLKETNEERRDRERQEEWASQREEGDPGYGEGADDDGETEEERRAREDEESGPPRT